MPIRPIDYQIVVNKTGDLSRDANFVRSRPDIEQFQFSEELQKKKIQDDKKVISTTKTEHKKIDNKERRDRRDSRGYTSDKEHNTESETKKDKRQLLKSRKSRKIDIMI